MKSLHHSFDIDLATEYGPEEAIVIHHFQHWIRLNRKRNKNFIENRTWSYQTLEEIADHFPYWTLEEVRTIVERLCFGQNRRSKKGIEFSPVLMKNNFNKAPFDKTSWYAFVDEDKFLNSKDSYERGNAQMQTGKCPAPDGEMPTPIPDTKTDTKKESSSSSSNPKKDQRPNDLLEWKKKMILLGWTKEEFEEAWRRYGLQSPESIKNVRRWLESVLQSIRDSGLKEDGLERRKDLAIDIKRRFPSNPDIDIGYDYIEFKFGMESAVVKFECKEFESEVKKNLRRMGLKL